MAKKVKVLILRTAGTNCDRETAFAFELAGAVPEFVHTGEFVRGKRHLKEFHIVALPGGFSFGDDVASGKILANELVAHLGEQLPAFVSKGGLVIGICNGFQTLVKCGLLPDIKVFPKQTTTLTFNDSQKFEARWIYLSAPRNVSVFAQGLPEKIYLPVAHGEGKFMVTDDKILDQLEANGQVVFKYVAPDNGPALYPWNPNGSSRDIAGLCDKTGRILGMMPHPERHSLPWQNPQWTRKGLRPEGDGLQLFKNAIEHVRRHIL